MSLYAKIVVNRLSSGLEMLEFRISLINLELKFFALMMNVIRKIIGEQRRYSISTLEGITLWFF